MKVDNALSREFLLRYPAEAARALEQVSVEHVAALFAELPPQPVTPVMAAMLPEMAAACLGLMKIAPAARLVTELPLSTAARIYRLLAQEKQEEISAQLPGKRGAQLHRHLEYPAESAGALQDPGVTMLTDNMSVAEALRRIEHLDHPVACEIYIINEVHHLVGMVDLGRLLRASHHARLRDIMSRKTHPIPAHTPVETLLSHPGWSKRQRLPVVDRDNTLVGVLEYASLQQATAEAGFVESRDPLENLLSLAGLYWLSVAQLLDSMLGIARPERGEKE